MADIEFDQPLAPGVVSDYKLEVLAYTGDASGTDIFPTTGFVQVKGIQEISPPSTEGNFEDDSDIDSGGWGSQIGTGIEYSLEGTAKLPRPGTDDPGQLILKKASRQIGQAGFVWWKLTSKTTGAGDGGLAAVEYKPKGGKRTDITTTEFTLNGRGALVEITAGGDDSGEA